MKPKPLNELSWHELVNYKRLVLPITDKKHKDYERGIKAIQLIEKEISKRPEFKQLMKG